MATPTEPIQRWVYEVVKVTRLPIPEELRDPACMIGPKVWVMRRIRRLAPWLVHGQRPRSCCWPHEVDWRQAAAIAVHLVHQAHMAGIPGEDIGEYVMDRVQDEHEDLDDRERTAILFLVGLDAGIQLSEPGSSWLYGDGQHRVAAQLDQGVRESIVQRVELLDPVTGRPVTYGD
ncbi:hypothetical protein [Nonomuraea dietziae]|uniref:hypothetical protein n=1 Tax=Nonomuraea dietziae TaxID=65515 RepID=UPI0033E5E72F